MEPPVNSGRTVHVTRQGTLYSNSESNASALSPNEMLVKMQTFNTESITRTWDLRSSLWWLWRVQSFRIWCHVVWCRFTNVLWELTACWSSSMLTFCFLIQYILLPWKRRQYVLYEMSVIYETTWHQIPYDSTFYHKLFTLFIQLTKIHVVGFFFYFHHVQPVLRPNPSAFAVHSMGPFFRCEIARGLHQPFP
jgi:hypothetical protein